MQIPFTQFLMPDGRQKAVTFECKETFDNAVKFLLLYDARFECEMLSTGDVSLTVEFELPDGEYTTLAHELSPNGPEIESSVETLLTRAVQALKDIERQQNENKTLH